jgi:fused signal recognition particle receptor
MFGWFKKKKPIEEEKEVIVETNDTVSETQVEAITHSEPLTETVITPELAPVPEPIATISEEAKKGLFEGLKRSSARIGDGITSIFTKAKLDEEALEELEELLILSDMGVETARKITTEMARRRFEKSASPDAIRAELAAIIAEMLAPYETSKDPWSGATRPQVIMFVGVNGSGKTTTIGKIAQNLVDNGHKIMLAAADTFRAAASEQLLVWGKRANVPVIAKESGADAAGLAFEALQKAKAEDKDILLIDTAGRLQNKVELMAELEKIIRVIKKQDESAPHETWLVLDATVGQNAISQAEAFIKFGGVTGLIMSKLDGTAKGGILLALTEKYKLPIYFIGVGEKVTDLQPFNASEFAKALVNI